MGFHICSAPSLQNLPLAFNQERQLTSDELDRLQSRAPVWPNIPVALRLRGALDRSALEASLESIKDRHSAFRSVIRPATGLTPRERRRTIDAYRASRVPPRGLYRQDILPAQAVTLRLVDYDLCRYHDAEARASAIIDSALVEPFDYSSPPFLRALLFRLAPNDHRLILVFPHLIGDLWSGHVLARELVSFYDHAATGEIAPVAPWPLGYHDFAHWQHHGLKTGYFDASIGFWRTQWKTFEPIGLSDLPFVRTSSENTEERADTADLALGAEASHRITSFTAASGITAFTLMVTALGVIVANHTGKSRLAVWSNFMNRQRRELQGLVGWCANAHIVGLDFTGAPSASQLLSRVRESVLGAMTHQESPLALVWCALGASFSRGGPRVFVDRHPVARLTSPSALDVERLDVPRGTELGGLHLSMRDGSDALTMRARYSRNHFDVDGIHALLAELRRTVLLLTGATHDRASGCAFDHPAHGTIEPSQVARV